VTGPERSGQRSRPGAPDVTWPGEGRAPRLTYSDVQSRARQVLRWQLACGVQHARSHVDVCDPQLRALRALVDLREEARGLIDLQRWTTPCCRDALTPGRSGAATRA
jgi:cytosine/adenosine deaminase-related metal-dependent hydrolase